MLSDPPVDRMLRPEPGRVCCLVCQRENQAVTTGDREWAREHQRLTGHTAFAGVAEVKTRG